MDEIHDQNTGNAPYKRKQEAYIAIEIKRHIRIIPPFVMKDPLQNEPGQPFECGYENRTGYVENDEIGSVRTKKMDDQCDSDTVDRTNWAIQKSAVYKSMLFPGGKSDFRTPAKKAIDEKVQSDKI